MGIVEFFTSVTKDKIGHFVCKFVIFAVICNFAGAEQNVDRKILDLKTLASKKYTGVEVKNDSLKCSLTVGPLNWDFSRRIFQNYSYRSDRIGTLYKNRLRQNYTLLNPTSYSKDETAVFYKIYLKSFLIELEYSLKNLSTPRRMKLYKLKNATDVKSMLSDCWVTKMSPLSE